MAQQDDNGNEKLQEQLAELLEHIKRSDTLELRQQVNDLYNMVRQVAGMNTVENVLMNGIDTLTAQLAPLRDLTPRRTPLGNEGNLRLLSLRQSLARPNWNEAGTLDLPREQGVAFIGQALPSHYIAASREELGS